jgi:hypothetical protein
LIRPGKIEGGAEKAYEYAAKLLMYYNCVALIEFSKIRIINWLDKHGFSNYMKTRPDFVTARWVNNPQTSNTYGIDPSTKHFWLGETNDYIEKNWDKFRDPEQITALTRFKLHKDYNCDDTIATSLCIVHWKDDQIYEIEKQREKDNDEEDNWKLQYSMQNGQIVLN